MSLHRDGEHMPNLVTVGNASLRLSPAGHERLETATDVRVHTTGTECNAAAAANRLGSDAIWLSKLPDSPLGRRILSELHEHGVATNVAWSDDGRQGLEFYESPAAPRGATRIDDRTNAAAATMTPGELRMDLVQEADAVFVAASTMALSQTAADTAKAVLRAGGGESGLSVFDMDYQPHVWDPETAREAVTGAFEPADVLFANEDDVETVLGRSGQARELAHTIAAEFSFDLVVITRSEHGAIAYHDGVIHERESVETETVDPTGQHDAFVGAFLARLLAGADTDEALAYGVAMAALTRTVPGPLTTIGRSDVEALVEDITGRRS